jgi:hypothetical protein
LALFLCRLGDFGYECSASANAASRKVFEALIDDEESHFDQYDTDMVNIDKGGEKYMAIGRIYCANAELIVKLSLPGELLWLARLPPHSGCSPTCVNYLNFWGVDRGNQEQD